MLSYPMVADGYRAARPGSCWPTPASTRSPWRWWTSDGDTISQLFTQLIRLPRRLELLQRRATRPDSAPLSVALVVPFGAPVQPPTRSGRHPQPGAVLDALDGEADALAQYPTVAVSVDAGARDDRHPGRTTTAPPAPTWWPTCGPRSATDRC